MRIIVTGASGYIGRNLISKLLSLNHEVIALARNTAKIGLEDEKLNIIYTDFLKPIADLPACVDVAYYLMHSMMEAGNQFAQLEQRVVNHFLQAIKRTKCKQIIYLSGLCNTKKRSPHLASRKAVAKQLINSHIPVTVLNAGIIVGSGSASYQIIYDLVNKLPIMTAPKWINSYCQPIAMCDAISYLVNALGNQACYNQSFDIGGPDVLRYKDMLYQFAAVCGLKRKIITIPVLTPRLSAYWLYFITSTDFNTAFSLIESVKHNAVCSDYRIHSIIKIKCLNYIDACKIALKAEP